MRQRVPTMIQVAVALSLAAMSVIAAGITPQLVPLLYLAAVTPWLVRIDVREHRLPNRLVLPGIVVALVAIGGEWIGTGRPPAVPLIAAAAYAGFLLVLVVIGGMGMGDAKLGAALGLASWTLAVAALSPVIGFLVGGLVAAAMLLAGKRGRRIAFGPYLLGGFWAALLLVAVSRVGERTG